jgi:STE24 endopeptidase
LFTGFGAWLRRLCARISGNRWFFTLALFAVAYLVVTAILTLPFDYYREQASLGARADQTTPEWALHELVTLVVRSVVAVLFLWIPYAFMARSPRFWWLYTAIALVPVVLFVLVVLPVWIDPLTTTYRPLKDAALSQEIESLAARCGVHDIPVLHGGDDTTVVGLGPTNRIILGDDLLRQSTHDEIRSVVGHELKHYVEGDNYKALAILSGGLLIGFFLVDRVGRWAIARFRRWFGFEEPPDPASLPLVVLILTGFYLLVLPLFNLYARHIEHEADRFSLELTHENRAMAENQAAYVTRDHDAPEWDTFFLIFRATHPSDAERIRFANTYRPWAEGKPLVYGDVCH